MGHASPHSPYGKPPPDVSKEGRTSLRAPACRDARLVRPLRSIQQEWNILGFMSVFEWTYGPCVPTFSALKAYPGPSKGGENKLAGLGM